MPSVDDLIYLKWPFYGRLKFTFLLPRFRSSEIKKEDLSISKLQFKIFLRFEDLKIFHSFHLCMPRLYCFYSRNGDRNIDIMVYHHLHVTTIEILSPFSNNN